MRSMFIELKNWVCSHPLLAVMFTFLLTLETSMVALEGVFSDPFRICAMCLLGLTALSAVLTVAVDQTRVRRYVFKKGKQGIGLFLALLVFSISLDGSFTPVYGVGITPMPMVIVMGAGGLELMPAGDSGLTPAECNLLGGTAALLVLIIGIIVIIKLIKFCQRNFGDSGSHDPAKKADEVSISNMSSLGSCSCEREGGSGGGPGPQFVTTIINLSVVKDDEGRPLMKTELVSNNPMTETLTFEQFAEEISAQGVAILDNGQGETFHSKGGYPIPVSESSIVFNKETGGFRIRSDEPTHGFMLQRSQDMEHWTTVTMGEIPEGMIYQFEEQNIVGEMFYRAILD